MELTFMLDLTRKSKCLRAEGRKKTNSYLYPFCKLKYKPVMNMKEPELNAQVPLSFRRNQVPT